MSSDEEEEYMDTEKFVDSVVADLRDKIDTFQLTNFGDLDVKHGTSGISPDQWENFQYLFENNQSQEIRKLVYGGMRYLYLNRILNYEDKFVHLYASIDESEDGEKKVLMVAPFLHFCAIITFNHNKLPGAPNEILNDLKEYVTS